jgi:6-phosphogluconolactonase
MRVILTICWIMLLLSRSEWTCAQRAKRTLMFVGSYTDAQPDSGIFVYRFNERNGRLKLLSHGEHLTNPSYLSVSSNGKFLYACTESKLPAPGSISAFAIDANNGTFSTLNAQSSMGENPVYLSVTRDNRFLINANYTGGSMSVHRIDADGGVLGAFQVMSFADSSIIKSRQESSHIHAAVFSPDERFVFLPDLGADKIRVLSFDPNRTIILQEEKALTVHCVPGSGPRHLVFNASGTRAYCIEELSGMVSVYEYANGQLTSKQRIFSYSKSNQETFGSADIHLSPDEKFLYASNRWDGENTLSIFSVEKENGQLTLVGHQSTLGEHPRNFAIDPSGKFVVVANLVSNNLVVFKRNERTGLLKPKRGKVQVPRPSCVKFYSYGN